MDRLPNRVFTEMVERLRPFAVLADVFVSLAIDETSSSDEYLVAYSVSRRNFDFSLSIKFRSRLIKILRVVLVTGTFGAPNCSRRYCSSSLLSSFKSSMSHKTYKLYTRRAPPPHIHKSKKRATQRNVTYYEQSILALQSKCNTARVCLVSSGLLLLLLLISFAFYSFVYLLFIICCVVTALLLLLHYQFVTLRKYVKKKTITIKIFIRNLINKISCRLIRTHARTDK